MLWLNDAARMLFSKESSDDLLANLLVVDSVIDRSETVEQMRFWLLAYLEERHPVLTAAMNEWSDDLESELSYCEALAAVLRREGLVKS
jgi:hypothetical protein